MTVLFKSILNNSEQLILHKIHKITILSVCTHTIITHRFAHMVCFSLLNSLSVQLPLDEIPRPPGEFVILYPASK